LGVVLGVNDVPVVSMSSVCIGPPELALDRYGQYEIFLCGPAYQQTRR